VFELHGRTALVTGGASGIGRAIARLFGARGARVVVLDLDAEAGEAVRSEIERDGGSAAFVRCDVTDPDDVQAAFASPEQLHVLINSAGVAHVGTVETTAVEDLDRVYATNVKGVFLCMRAAVARMREQAGGSIVNLASIASLVGVRDRFAYSMSKGAVLTMTRSVAVDYVKLGIRCNCICPARIHTPFVDGFLAANYPGREQEMFAELSAYQPIGRMGLPEEVAALALYLASDEAGFVTGQAYPLDGGVLNE
jgi:NAD(P)-dependent dehydrogenase (short-subunit alcohol dehydrogenase family)